MRSGRIWRLAAGAAAVVTAGGCLPVWLAARGPAGSGGCAPQHS